ncbi:uncharacterized protein LOC109843116 [Asparagus officinalis]|nr:uncharacterized protein LOC109843116 [Asparagus officinalis]
MMMQGNESGYGSEPGYRGDGELGEEDGEFDEEEEDGKVMFWGGRFARDTDRMEIIGENNFAEQKAHHRCRRKKQHDWRLIASLR